MKNFKLDEHTRISAGFQVPDGYFDQLPENVLQQLPPTPKVIPLYQKRTSWIYAAAAVLVLSVTIPMLNQFKTEPDAQALEHYLSYHTDITDDQLVELLEGEDIGKMTIDYHLDEREIEAALYASPNLEQQIAN